MVFYDVVVVGGGVSGGDFIKNFPANTQQKVALISANPASILPYERPACSKGCLDPDKEALRDPSNDAFPFIEKNLGANENVTLLSGVSVVSHNKGNRSVELSDGISIEYDKLVIATGCRSRCLKDCGGVDSETWAHSDDLDDNDLTVKDKGKYGFGSVHTLHNIGDSVKLVAAMQRIEEDDQETNYDPVVVVGGGFIAMEVCSQIASNCPDLHVTVVMDGPHFLPGLMNKEMSEYYEQQLTTKFGVRFARNFSVKSLWEKSDVGEFCSLDGPAFNLQRTRPRLFGDCPPQFTECRGVKLREVNNEDGDDIALAARFVVFGVGSKPNNSVFGDSVELARSGHVIVDENMRTSDDNIFAIGDIAVLRNSCPNEHVWSARNQGKYLAENILSAKAGTKFELAFSETPHFYSRIMDLSWKFFGKVEGSIITVGLKSGEEGAGEGESEEKKEGGGGGTTFGAFYISEDNIIVGVFLESASEDLLSSVEGVIGTKVLSRKSLAKLTLDEIFNDPSMLEPPPLLLGEFHAELNEQEVRATFSTFEFECECIKTDKLGDLMASLNADFDEEEIADAKAGLDPTQCGVVSLETFLKWWMN